MYNLPDLEKATGFTANQLRDRLGLLSPILGDDVHRGTRGKVIVGDRILAALRRMVELEREGLSPRVAQGQIIEELGPSGGNGGRPSANVSEGLLRELLDEKERTIIRLESENERLRSEVDRLLPLALPSPRRRSFLARWLHPVTG